ncbi:MAG: UDP-N-acetylmuramoyl-L-alanyl-D-glutamate--2,6-diaminopimelate ligase [Anaerolineae bacterium]|nr:UDP-N-acetylmuramoyl-L-alanyl-D-glutamate--2,6-diaminopimelate ligase [Anaerolineae bacterium]
MSAMSTGWDFQKLAKAAGLPSQGLPRQPIRDLQTDSRRVCPGSLFIAYRGLQADGHDYIAAAVRAGAVAVVAERTPPEAPNVPLLLVPDGRIAWAHLEAAWHGFPSRELRLAGVTGTDGKTTTTTLLHHILTQCGVPTGLISTVEAHLGQRVVDTGLHTSTPPPSQVQPLLREMVDAGCRAAVLEATSEGLAQRRLEACEFDLAIITNITHDHLYFHRTLESYREAKALLFHYLSAGARKPGVTKTAVLNRDDSSYQYLRAIETDRHLSYGASRADTIIEQARDRAGGLSLALSTPWGRTELDVPLLGQYNAWNVAAALTAACAWGIPLQRAAHACSTFPGVPGRMQFIQEGQPFSVIVDFAHTANALEQALRAVRPITRGRLIVVFGCAGERDVLKRGPMATAAIRLADYAVFTAEDPRREDLDSILAQMESAALAAGGRPGVNYSLVPDRGEAIGHAISEARPGDTVIICGKGHEQSMCFGCEERPWDDRTAARAALRARGHISI